MAFALRCPDCRKAFRYDPLKTPPRYCPLCQADMGEEKDDTVISIPAFLSAKTKGTDQVYRDIESSSVVRAERAAEMAGVPVSEMSDLKITDLRSTRYPGEVAAPPVVNDVTRHMEAVNSRGGQLGFGGGNGAELAAGIRSGAVVVDGRVVGQGIGPNAGAKTLGAIQRQMFKI